MKKIHTVLSFAAMLGSSTMILAEDPSSTQLLWGDTHLHTSFSPDAYFLGNRSADPHTAYRYAKGLPIINAATRARVQIDRPLDFLVVADHAEMMGVPYRLFRGDPQLASTKIGQRFIKMVKEGRGTDVFLEFLGNINAKRATPEFNTPEVRRSVWQETSNIAEQYNEPGKFSALIGWEWTSTPGGNNLHRVIFSAQNAEQAQTYTPFSALDNDTPEGLWQWLDQTSRAQKTDFVSIPHNSNISSGLMFNTVDSEGRTITADYARTRMRWEPVAEITQIKGDSETHPLLSPNDEFADFETYRHLLSAKSAEPANVNAGSYLRSTLMRGLELEQKTGVNPYKLGLIGSSDAHTGQAGAEELNFAGKVSVFGKPEALDQASSTGVSGWDFSASGIAAVWAEENTRESIFQAFKRKEVYATSGSRIGLRFFGGWDFSSSDARSSRLAKRGYRKGVPMGGDLTAGADGRAPSFLIQAVKDPEGANLDRVQVVKGFTDANGQAKEKVYDVALADASRDKQGRLANTVNLKTGVYQNSTGASDFALVWKDPSFDPKQRAFYYVRVLEISTPRHTLLDAIALQKEHPAGHSRTIQERAYSSPIWYTPR